MPKFSWIAVAAGACLALAGCSSSNPPAQTSEAPKQEPAPAPAPVPPPPAKKAQAPDTFKVNFDTSRGTVVVELHRDWAPIGVDHFYELVQAGYYNGARFFRVIPNFVVQFGIAGDPQMTARFASPPLTDDPVRQHNTRGTMVYATAGPNTRTTQMFINLKDNSQSLDPQGFAPIGQVVTGMDVVDSIFPYEVQDQGAIERQGNAYLAQFPKLDYIKTATIQ
jgi:cyclophilin family peptidyl-prolyl cis-trans isomerase